MQKEKIIKCLLLLAAIVCTSIGIISMCDVFALSKIAEYVVMIFAIMCWFSLATYSFKNEKKK